MKIGKLNFSEPRQVLFLTIGVAAALIAIGFFSGNIGVMGIVVTISVFVVVTPQMIFFYQSYRLIKEMEEKFPSFLRDLIENIRSGVPFHKSIILASKSDYGSLTPEVRKMANQLSWGVTLDKVLDKFAERVKASRRLYTSAKIIRESFSSGGEVVSTLESVSESATILEDTEKEKKSMLSQYVMLMYAIAIIFVVIIGSISKFLVPLFSAELGAAAGGDSIISLENPCNICTGIECDICWFYKNMACGIIDAAPSGVKERVLGGDICLQSDAIIIYYTALFFMMALVQSILSGLVAGQISEGSIKAGIKHSVILGGITVLAFFLMIYLGLGI